MWRHALPFHWRGINGRTPERAIFETVVLPCALRTLSSVSVDWVKPMQSHETQLLRPGFWSRQLTLLSPPLGVMIQSKDSLVSTTTRFTKLLMASTTEMSLKSMKSFPEGFLKDLSSKTVFARVWHQYRERAACWHPLALTVFIKLYQGRYLQKVNYCCPTLSQLHSEQPICMSPDSLDI